MLSGLISVFTTAGILYVLAAETVHFFAQVSLLEFLTGTEWTPLFADKHFGILPLVAARCSRAASPSRSPCRSACWPPST